MEREFNAFKAEKAVQTETSAASNRHSLCGPGRAWAGIEPTRETPVGSNSSTIAPQTIGAD